MPEAKDPKLFKANIDAIDNVKFQTLAEFQGKSAKARAALRQANAKPIFDDLEEWLQAQLPKISGKSPLAKAILYALNRTPKTRPYLNKTATY